jgi:TonB family protein
MTEVWKKWEGEVINGAFPLRRFLGGSDHSGVFLTEHQAQNLPNAAIKIVPADPARAETQLSRWRMAASLSHPHLIRLLDAGRCQLGDEPFVFVVMEYAEQSLSEILPHRALTADEVRELLLPTLDALAFLHRRNLVQGHLKPSNFLVVDDELKLASDTIHSAGESATVIAEPSVYDPPEAKDGRISAAGDVWGLGVTLIETLTQSTEIGSLPATLPPRFVETVWRCRSRNPDDRPTVIELEAQFGRPPPAPVVSIPQPAVSIPEPVVPIPQAAVHKVAERAAPPAKSPGQRRLVPTVTGLIVVVVAVWVSLRLFHSHPNSQRPAPSPSQISPQPAAPPAVPAPPEVPVQPPAEAPASVLHEEIPNVPRSSSDTIHGTITVVVRVTVDRSGRVVDETLENPGPSRYFARLATTAARNWKFSPTDRQNSREWLVSFAFTRDSTTGHATPPE